MSSKRERRLEAKKRKVAAFLEIAEQNDKERKKNKSNDEDQDDDDPSPLPRLDGADYFALRERLRLRKALLKRLPHFDLKRCGHDASVDNADNQRSPLLMSDLRALIMHATTGGGIAPDPLR